MKIGFIGTGHIAAPMARFLATKGHEICVSDRNSDTAALLKARIGTQVADNQTVVDGSDVVFLCLRPQIAVRALEPLTFRTDQKIVSVMAGVSRQELETLCAPCTDFVQTIPIGFLESGGCPLPAFGNDALLSRLFAPENPVIAVASQAGLNAHFALCAFLPGVLDLMATGAQWLGQQTGDVKSAEFYTAQLLSGFLADMPKQKAGQLARERDALATAGTLSLQMTSGLRDGNAHIVLSDILDQIGERLRK